MSIIFDPILFEVIRHELVTIAEEMNITMKLTTRSAAAKEANDFSAGLLASNGSVLSQAIPMGSGYLHSLIPFIMAKYGGKFRPGDVIASNDPYAGLSHLPDIALVVPIFWQDKLVGFGTVVEHHTDIGGRFLGGTGIACESLYEEGLRLPAVRLYRDGEMDFEIRQIIEANVRAPEDVIGDIEAGVAACRRGARGLHDLLDKYGLEAIEYYSELLQKQTEDAMRAELTKIPDGSYGVEDFLEDGAGTRIKIALTLRINGSSLVMDFTGTGDQAPNALNCPPGLIGSMLVQNFFYQFIGDKSVMINSGMFRPFTTVAPEGTIVNPRFPAAVGARGQILNRAYDMLFDAMAKAVPSLMPANGEGGIGQMWFTSQPSGSTRPVAMMEIFASGQGGTPVADGVEGVQLPYLAGFGCQSGESMERNMPIALEGFGFVPDTGGPGKNRGALSIYRSWRYLVDGRVLLRNNRVESSPRGVAGGAEGTKPRVTKISDGVETDIPVEMMMSIPVKAGDVLTQVQPGAGGWGDPFEREVERVLTDVLDEKITAPYAEREYGVVLDGTGTRVDLGRTEALRRKRRFN